jgi:dihydrofolate reductase
VKLSLIVAMSRNNVIGKDGGLPWDRIPEDMANFRRLTMGKPVIMGRKTWQSLDGPLDGRVNIVLSRSTPYFRPKDAVVAWTPVEAIVQAFDSWDVWDVDEAFVIGGAEVYALFFNLCTDAYVTTINRDIDGDVRWAFNFRSRWNVEESRELAPGVLFRHLTRTRGAGG